jgi:hypothetical protein
VTVADHTTTPKTPKSRRMWSLDVTIRRDYDEVRAQEPAYGDGTPSTSARWTPATIVAISA